MIDVSEKRWHLMKFILPALALMLSAVSFAGCDSNYDGAAEAEEALLDDADAARALKAASDDEDAESALEAEFDLAAAGDPSFLTPCSQWKPTPFQCEKADNSCLDPELTPGPCAVLTQCIMCNVDWSGGV
ncbi:hypothetical protein OV079_49975 [Nannocystis pusilla]|uniref:Secreted protein n=1 Tax=Nannocystis pusilla TaxID=889268 RepID=A0A9X3J282_9BACT|nr:hypothetical protein [Nannocystis pusilla]MCY1013527.1 hypothetical protein [Nannocystis pusilla]